MKDKIGTQVLIFRSVVTKDVVYGKYIFQKLKLKINDQLF